MSSRLPTSLRISNTSPETNRTLDLWLMRLFCTGGLWSAVSRHDTTDRDFLPRLYGGVKLRRHLIGAGFIHHNQRFLQTGDKKDLDGRCIAVQFKEAGFVKNRRRLHFLWRLFLHDHGSEETPPDLSERRSDEAGTLGDYCRILQRNRVLARLFDNDGTPRCLSRALRYLESSCPDSVESLPGALAKNLLTMQSALELTNLEVRILAFVILSRTDGYVYSFLNSYLDYRENGANLVIDTLSVALQENRADVEAALSHDATLIKIGLLAYQEGGSDFDDWLDAGNTISPMVMAVELPLQKLLNNAFVPAPPPSLTTENFPHLPALRRVLLPYLQHGISERSKGINILLYGAPGCGKTELTRIIAKELGLCAYEVQMTERAVSFAFEKEDSRTSRLKFWKIADRVLARGEKQLLVIDEAEDVFNDMGENFFSGRTNKGEINRILESNAVATIWTANTIHQIDPAMLRRFSMIVEVTPPGLDYRRNMLRESFEGRIGEKTLECLALTENLSSAVIDRIADVARVVASANAAPVDGDVLEMAKQMLKAQRLGRISTDADLLPALYSPEFVNAELDLRTLVEGLKTSGSGRMCIYGPPGTGKSAFAAYVARELRIPVVRKTGAELTSCYVGETEKLIAQAFEVAQRDGVLLLLDEVDSFLRNRQGARYGWEVTAVNEMLAQMERFNGYLIATTNLMDDLDPASLRRFDLKTKFDYLRADQVAALTEAYCRELDLKINGKAIAQAKTLNYLTPGDFAAVRRQAAFRPLADVDDLVSRLRNEADLKAPGMADPKRWIL